MTGRTPPQDTLTSQKSYLQTLPRKAGREADSGALSEADASKLIDQLPVVSGRGRDVEVTAGAAAGPRAGLAAAAGQAGPDRAQPGVL